MTAIDFARPASTVARSEDNTVFVALELSRKSWLVATSAPGESKISKRNMAAGDSRSRRRDGQIPSNQGIGWM
jgi:hypothetical protein